MKWPLASETVVVFVEGVSALPASFKAFACARPALKKKLGRSALQFDGSHRMRLLIELIPLCTSCR